MCFSLTHYAFYARTFNAFYFSERIRTCMTLLILIWYRCFHNKHLLLCKTFFCTAGTTFPVEHLITSTDVTITPFSAYSTIGGSFYSKTTVTATSSGRRFMKRTLSAMRASIDIRHKTTSFHKLSDHMI